MKFLGSLKVQAFLILICSLLAGIKFGGVHGALAGVAIGFVVANLLTGSLLTSLRGNCLGVTSDITLSGLTETLYKARDTVARELIGAIPSVLLNGGTEGVSLNGTVKSLKTSAPTLNTSHTPSMVIPEGDAQTTTTEEVQIEQTANVKIPLQGETTLQLINTIGFEAAMMQLYGQAFRVIANAIEAHTLGVIYKGASRAVGTPGTTPFASTHGLIVDTHNILKDNGCPEGSEISLILGTAASGNLKKLTNVYKVNESGSSDVFRRGVLLDIDGVAIKESAQIASHTKGAGTGYDIVTAGEAIGQTTLTLEGGTVNSTGFKAGDVIALDTDTANKYVVRTGLTATSGDLVINDPGLRVAGVDASELTIGNSYTANVMFERNAVELIMRPPALPMNIAGGRGDNAAFRTTLFDEKSKLTFEVAIYLGYYKNMIDITTYYQAKAWKSDFIATLMG